MTKRTENFIKSLATTHPGMPLDQIARLASTSANEVRKALTPKRRAMSPTYGPFAETPEPQTSFERDLKAAGTFATLTDAADSIAMLNRLLDRAREENDLGAEGAVVMRAQVLHFRARGLNKITQAQAYANFIAMAMGLSD